MNYMGARSETDSTPIYSSAFEQITPLSFKITFPDSADLTTGESLVIYSVNDESAFRLWFNKDGGGGSPLLVDEIPVETNISTGFTAIQIAQAAFSQLNA